jgi:hypothetical protein
LKRINLALGFRGFPLGSSGLFFNVFEFVLTLGEAALGFIFTPENAASGRISGDVATAEQYGGQGCEAKRGKADEG